MRNFIKTVSTSLFARLLAINVLFYLPAKHSMEAIAHEEASIGVIVLAIIVVVLYALLSYGAISSKRKMR